MTLNVVERMTGSDKIAEVIGIFHDGIIAGGVESESAAELIVEIRYLAERVQQEYRRFTIYLGDLDAMRFVPWIDEGADSIADFTEFGVIVGLDLGVLSAEVFDSVVRVACTQDQPGCGYCGGILEIAAGSCRVLDEAGKEWTLDELRKLSDCYWSDWAAQNEQAQQGAADQLAAKPRVGG